jgi:uncharacterized protein
VHARAAQLIASLGLIPHPEGGHYLEVYRSVSRVQPRDGRSERSSLTNIHFLLSAGEISRWHRVRSDEVWHYHEGDALELFIVDSEFKTSERHLLGRPGDGVTPSCVVPAGMWQAARCTGAYTFVGCTVAPGFEFEDFQMLRDSAADVAALVERQPLMRRLV